MYPNDLSKLHYRIKSPLYEYPKRLNQVNIYGFIFYIIEIIVFSQSDTCYIDIRKWPQGNVTGSVSSD